MAAIGKKGLDRNYPAAALALGAGLLALAWANRFVQDDAFITFRYARNLADGLGLVWNSGERVEGYTNFLWTVLVAAGMKLGLDPVAFTQGAGLLLYGCSLFLAWRIARESGLSSLPSLAVLLLAGTNYTFSSYATGGLETSLVTALFLSGLLLALKVLSGALARDRALWLLSAVATAGLLTRLDTALLLAVPAVAVLTAGPARDGTPGDGRSSAPDRRAIAAGLVKLCALPAAVVGAWLLWKLSYYGDLLPRAFYLKAVGAGSLERGLRYFYEFASSYWLLPFAFFALFRFGNLFLRPHRAQLLMAAAVALWCAYVLKVGGDFMEYRFLVPVIPPAMAVLVWMLVEGQRKPWVLAAGVAILLAGSYRHATAFRYDQETGVEPVRMLSGHLDAPDENWVGIGKALAAAFGPSDGVVVATTAAGAIPYHSGLRSVDMLGLNEPAGNDERGEPEGVLVGSIPGHQRVRTVEYLNRRGVNLVVSHPIVTRPGDPPAPLPLLPASGPPHLDAALVMMPIGGGYRVSMLYIRPHPAVDAAIAALGWDVRRIRY